MKGKKLHILLVAHAFFPDKRVGALRMSYWYRQLPLHYDCTVEVITAESEANFDKVHIVSDNQDSPRFSIINDQGIIWRKKIKQFLKKDIICKPDIVIISGGPFMHFSLAKDFKRLFDCSVILDYRDPFARNPGFANSSIKILVKSYFEKRFNRIADGLTTVNTHCSKLITDFYKKPNAIVQNGFDESVIVELSPVELKNPVFSYTGKFYFDPKPILIALSSEKCHLHYAGKDSEYLHTNKNEFIHDHGLVDYESSVNIIAESDVGIIQTFGEDFQSTTKIFDYIRCCRAILIVSDKNMYQGSIFEELKEYPNVFWTENNEIAIQQTLKELKKSTYVQPEIRFTEKFSRLNQMHKLWKLIEEIS